MPPDGAEYTSSFFMVDVVVVRTAGLAARGNRIGSSA